MSIRTTRDLKRYLEVQKLSPEAFAKKTKISNMTIRRMMQKPGNWKLPDKYHLALDFQMKTGPDLPSFSLAGDFKVLMNDLEKSGRSAKDVTKVVHDAELKLAKAKMGKNFASHVKFLMNAVTDRLPLRSRLLAAGALLYFVNPFDLIPDAIVGVGYLDDFAVLALVCSHLGREFRKAA